MWLGLGPNILRRTSSGLGSSAFGLRDFFSVIRKPSQIGLDNIDKHIIPWKGESFKVPTLEEIREARKKRLVATMICVYGDESHDEWEQRVYAVAGLMGTQEEWDQLKPIWIARTGGKPFHAVDADSDQGDYSDIPHEENKKLFIDLVNILAESTLEGYGMDLDLTAYQTYFGNNSQYLHCFERVVRHFCDRGIDLNKKVKFTFHTNLKIEADATSLYYLMVNSNEPKLSSCMDDEVGFASNKLVEIQVACLWARECMKHVDNLIGPKYRETRKSMKVLLDTGRFECAILEEKYWRDFRIDIMKKGDYRDGFNPDDYEKWRKAHRLIDNKKHKMRYIAYLESLKKDQGRK